MGIFDFITHPGKGYKDAQKEYTKGWEQTQGYEKPYWQQGMDQMGQLTDAEGKLLDPAALQNEWASGYEMSPYAQQLQKESQNQGLGAASSMGLMGSSAALQNIQQGSSNIMQQDRQQYMDDLMKKYTAGLGIGQNMYNTGAQMGGQLGNQSMNYGEGMGNLKMGEQNSKNQMMQQLMEMAIRGGMAYGTGGMSEAGQYKSGDQYPEYLGY